MRPAVNVSDETIRKHDRQDGERGGVGSAEDDVRFSDSGGLFRGAVAPDPVPAAGGAPARPAAAEPVRPGRR